MGTRVAPRVASRIAALGLHREANAFAPPTAQDDVRGSASCAARR